MRTSFPSRTERAQELADSGRIVRSGNEYLVPSLTSDLVYRVRMDGDRVVCNCEDFQQRQQACKHVLAATLVHARQRESAT